MIQINYFRNLSFFCLLKQRFVHKKPYNNHSIKARVTMSQTNNYSNGSGISGKRTLEGTNSTTLINSLNIMENNNAKTINATIAMSEQQKKKIKTDHVYYEENGLRKVQPYEFQYETTTKKRWFDRSIYNVFSSEFHDRHPDYYKVAINSGRITVNNKVVDKNHVLKNGDVIRHKTHRHEPPVVWTDEIEIVHKDDDLMAISKPASIPVHPSGRYNYNTLISLLEYEQGYKDLALVNRLDRLTSGLVLLARSKAKAQKMMLEMKTRTIKKTYLCRVKGCFPEEEIICDKPIKTVVHKIGLNQVDEDGKPCLTIFKRLSFNGRTSLVLCKPMTGRTHQIRVHLQYLGFPIANDPFYCRPHSENVSADGEAVDILVNQMLPLETGVSEEAKANNENVDCLECQRKRADPIPQQLYIYLHAWKYESDEWSFETSLPDWASEHYEGDKELEERFWKYDGLWDGKPVGEY